MADKNKRILVVEDDPDGQAIMAHVFEFLNVAVDVVEYAEEAEVLLYESGAIYHAVIIDLALPGKNGWQLLETIRTHPSTTDLLCVATTAYHTSKTREEAFQAGFNLYFAKPLDANVFAKEISPHL